MIHSRFDKVQYWLAGFGILFLLIIIFSEGTYDSGDGIQHYLFSRYSWKHPELFLHLWAKPFLTLISSLFTQAGIRGAHLFNLLCALGTACLTYNIAKRFEIPHASFTVPFLFLSPVYFGVVHSGLTEPFFGLVLVAGIYGLLPAMRNDATEKILIFEPRILFSSLLISFLPYIRSEGYLILPLFFIVLLYRKKYWAIPLLVVGTAIYSIAGYFYYNDLLWLIHQNPYGGASEIYGKGEIYHFLIRAEFIWGLPLSLLFAGGCLWLLKAGIQSINHSGNRLFTEEVLLVYGSFFIYFLAHTIFWWQGIFSSLGLIRVLAAVMPVGALITLRGYNSINIFNTELKKKSFNIILFAFVIILAFFHNRSALRLNDEDAVIVKASKWIIKQELSRQKIFYLHPYVTHALELDPFDRTTTGELWGLEPDKPESNMASGELLLWESHFGPNEGRIKIETLINNPSFKLLGKFVPEKDFKVLGGRNFEVYLFERK